MKKIQSSEQNKSLFNESKLLIPRELASGHRDRILGVLEHSNNPDYWIFIPDKERQPQVSHPSPAKGKPVYKVSPLSHGGMMREARVSGNIKLELPLLKDGKLADLGDLVQDLMTAYYNIEWELEAKTLFSDNAA
jgi:hypothetical protein